MGHVQSIDVFIEEQLRRGRFDTREELVNEALRQMMDREMEVKALAEYLRAGALAWKRGEQAEPFDPEALKREAQKEILGK